MRKFNMSDIQSGKIDLVSSDAANGVWNPMTGALSTVDIVDVKFQLWLTGRGEVKVRPGLQCSDDGIAWSDAAVAVDATWYNTDGWHFDDGDWEAIASLVTLRLFVRFGLWAKNNASSTATEGALAQLVTTAKPQVARTVTAGPIRAWSNGTTDPTDRLFIPMTEWIPAEQALSIRGTVEMAAPSGSMGIKCCWQQCNEPTVPSDWSGGTSAEAFGTERTTDGIAYGTTFATTAFTKKYVRFGVYTRTITDDVIRACQATIRVDLRS